MIVQTNTANEGAIAKIMAPTRNTTELMMIDVRLPKKSTINPRRENKIILIVVAVIKDYWGCLTHFKFYKFSYMECSFIFISI